jgi:hypothetical protein
MLRAVRVGVSGVPLDLILLAFEFPQSPIDVRNAVE